MVVYFKCVLSPASSANDTAPMEGESECDDVETPVATQPKTVHGGEDNHDNDSKHASVLFDFEGDAPNELTVRAGEKLVILEKVDEEWLHAYVDMTPERKGIIPTGFVCIKGEAAVGFDDVEAKTVIGRARCSFDFLAEMDDELQLEKGREALIDCS